MKTRYLKTIIFAANKAAAESIEDKINVSVDAIAKCGGSIVSFLHHQLGISPIHYVYDIVYERDRVITEAEFEKAKAEVLESRKKA